MSSSTSLLNSGNEEAENNEKCLTKLIDVEEAKIQILFSAPMILTNLATYAVPLVSVMFAGHLGHLELAGATLANSWGIVTGFALMTGLSGALETLCGQAYGAKLYRMLGIYLQSSIIMTTFFSILVSVTWYFSETVLVWLHQDPSIAKVASTYLRFLIPGLFGFAYLQCLLRYFQTQSIVIPLVVCSVLPLCIHVGLAYSLIYKFGLGFKGASLATSISIWLLLIMLLMYAKFSEKCKYTWKGFTVESFKYLLPNLKIALPSAVMVCLECWSFEILVLLAGLMPNSESSTSLIAMCVNTESIAYMITYGFSAAVSTRVSNEIGAGNIRNAKNAVAVTLKLSCFLALTVLLSLAFGHRIWALSFTDSIEIVQQFSYMTALLSVSILVDSAQGVLSGVARGCGWQHLAAWTNFVAFYMIGMPLSLLFGFKLGFYDKGLWMGLCCGLFCQTTILLVITVRSKWARLDLTVTQDDQNKFLA